MRFRRRVVRKMIGPPVVSANALAKDVGVCQATLSRWLRDAVTVAPVNKETPRPSAAAAENPKRSWSAQEKLQAVAESMALSPEELGALLRRAGLHQAQLDEWRATIVGALEEEHGLGSRKARKLDKRVRELEKELRRKDRALAETAALLVLEKKVQALWGAEDSDTKEESEQ